MSLQDIVNVTISKETASVSRTGFGTPMIMSTEAYEDSRFSETSKEYAELSEMGSTGDNFDTAGATYKLAQTIFAQNPKVSKIVIGKRANSPTPTINLTPIAKDSTKYSVTIGGRGTTGSVEETFEFTSDATATVSEITAGLVALINAGSQKVLATDNTTYLTIETAATPGGISSAGKPFTLVVDRTLLESQNVTTDPGIATDLTAIRTSVDGNDDWYCAYLDSYGKAEITSMSAAIETLEKLYIATTSDADVITSATDDIGSNLKASSYARTVLCWHQTPLYSDMGAAWGGKILPSDAGSVTWKFKTLSGPAPTNFSSSELGYLSDKNVNNYIQKTSSNNMTQEGVTSSGEFIDITRGIDFITARLREDVFAEMVKLPKIPFTDQGIAIVENVVRGVMALGVSQSIFSPDPEPTVTVPLASEVSSNNKATRYLPDVKFTAVLAGAIHSVKITGIVTV